MNQDFDVHIEGDTVVLKNFERIQAQSANLTPAFRQIRDMLLASHEENFKQKGRRFGNEWPPRKYYYPWPIMRRTGRLSRGFAGSYTSSSATVANTVPYAAYHQTGTRYLPVRNLVGFAGDGGKVDINEAVRIIRKHLRLEAMGDV